MSCGIPVIATEVGGTGELVDSSNGFLIDQNFEYSELTHLIRSFYLSKYGDKDVREKAFLGWKCKASSENNYLDFVQFLHEVILENKSQLAEKELEIKEYTDLRLH